MKKINRLLMAALISLVFVFAIISLISCDKESEWDIKKIEFKYYLTGKKITFDNAPTTKQLLYGNFHQ